ncbi:hypothetical protein CYMTET_21369 [Cymbomonas tetramitiformis]|uniref:Uncharacterized protein n=1 Tax=Cymbomonas tetramitiformis TaxID=36881 RepID=A0AAE0G2I1_9CHLO|nr:hypothetical protein CYMTET_21369 [Cymbomonas tetramitiformis]
MLICKCAHMIDTLLQIHLDKAHHLRSSYQRYKARILEEKGELPATSAFPVAKAVVTKISYHEEVFREWADTNMLKGAPQRMPVSGARQIPPIDYGVQYDLYKLDTEDQWAVCAETFKIYVKNLLKAISRSYGFNLHTLECHDW